MPPPALQLPAEVWNHILGYLSLPDKSSVRASCRHFKTLVDNASLWKDWSVHLGFQKGSYNSQFWATLRRRRVTSVVMRSTKAKDWRQLAQCLPALTTVVMDRSCHASLDALKHFPGLRRLAIRNSSKTSLELGASTVQQPQQLTHLSICNVTFDSSRMDKFISSVSQFTNLTSLVCHEMWIFEETIWMVRSMLDCLPKLKHLSLSDVKTWRVFPDKFRSSALEGAGAPVLSSFELINCTDDSLPEDAMRLMPSLKNLAVFYQHTHQQMPSPDACQLKTWLSDLPQLSTLVVVKGPPVMTYITSIPATVTSLTLCVAGLSPEDMAAVSLQAPNLLHLHIDPWPSHLGAHTGQIARLFPKLKSLKLRHEHVPERAFLRLHQLQDLEYLEILDSSPHLSELTDRLRALTKDRLQITASPRRRDVLLCPCVCQVY